MYAGEGCSKAGVRPRATTMRLRSSWRRALAKLEQRMLAAPAGSNQGARKRTVGLSGLGVLIIENVSGGALRRDEKVE